MAHIHMGANTPEESLLPRLGNLSKIRPRRVSRLIGLIWPDIRAALEAGHTLRFIHKRLEECGVTISYNQLTVYVSRQRRLSKAKTPKQSYDPAQPHEESEKSGLAPGGSTDPLENYREHCIQNPPGFRSTGGVPDKSKLI